MQEILHIIKSIYKRTLYANYHVSLKTQKCSHRHFSQTHTPPSVVHWLLYITALDIYANNHISYIQKNMYTYKYVYTKSDEL